MKLLSIDTSSEICSVALLENNNLIKELSINDALTHSQKLMPLIKQLLDETNTSINDIDLFACDKGPGSFTGIRIGISTVKAFADAMNKPIIGISSLKALSYNIKDDGYICSLIDAKNNNVYYSLFNHFNNTYTKIGDYLTDDISNLLNILKNYNNSIFFVGNGSIVYNDMIKSVLGENAIIKNTSLSATNVGIAAFDVYNSCSDNDYTNISPLYLKKSSAERLLNEKNANNN